MNFIRENLLKIVILTAIIIIVVVLVSSCGHSTPKTVGQKYEMMENNMKEAAQKMVDKNERLLPSEINTSKKITLSTLVRNKKINQLYANENDSVLCTGYVSIIKIAENRYLYRPFLKCGKYYETKTIAGKILSTENIVTEGNGLYQVGDEYIYRGEKPHNYLKIGERTYRILSINSNKELKLVTENTVRVSYRWDNRYNITTKRNTGINDFDKSRIKDSLSYLYERTNDPYFSDAEKAFIVPQNYCIGKLSIASFKQPISKEVECSVQEELYVGLMTPSDYVRPSLDTSCTTGRSPSCQNYNYLYTDVSSYVATLNAVSDNTYEVVVIDSGVLDTVDARASFHVNPVIYINKATLYSGGDGTIDNPYTVR